MKRSRIISPDEAAKLWATYQRVKSLSITSRLHKRRLGAVHRALARNGYITIRPCKRRTLVQVRAMHAAYMTGLSLRVVGRPYGICHSTVREHFRRRGLPVRPNKWEPKSGRNKDGSIRKARPHTPRQIEVIIARMSKPMIPPELRLEWRTWSLERRGDFIQRVRAAHPSPKDMPNTPCSSNVSRFNYATPAAWEILLELNKGLNSRAWKCKMDLRSEGFIWRGQLFFWSANYPEQGGAFYKGNNGPYDPRVGRPSLAHLIYETHHRCKLSAGSVVRVKDGNYNNLDPSNLIRITRNDVARENQAAHLKRKSRELTAVLLKRAQRKETHHGRNDTITQIHAR